LRDDNYFAENTEMIKRKITLRRLIDAAAVGVGLTGESLLRFALD